MHGVVRTDQEVRAGFRKLAGRREHQVADRAPVVALDALHVLAKRVRMHRDLRMVVDAQIPFALEADRAIAESSALRRYADDADVLGHQGSGGTSESAGA